MPGLLSRTASLHSSVPIDTYAHPRSPIAYPRHLLQTRTDGSCCKTANGGRGWAISFLLAQWLFSFVPLTRSITEKDLTRGVEGRGAGESHQFALEARRVVHCSAGSHLGLQSRRSGSPPPTFRSWRGWLLLLQSLHQVSLFCEDRHSRSGRTRGGRGPIARSPGLVSVSTRGVEGRGREWRNICGPSVSCAFHWPIGSLPLALSLLHRNAHSLPPRVLPLLLVPFV